MVYLLHHSRHVVDIEVDRARNRRVEVTVLGLRIDGWHLACLGFTDEIRDMGGLKSGRICLRGKTLSSGILQASKEMQHKKISDARRRLVAAMLD
ncbi:hypothetical protein HDE71_001699 [Janthinobacterium sp. S3M3]|nr:MULTISPECIES: hypothetical protein [unclassified Janthinobacterium]MBB5606969.1 hypothetical protein [Janthinobacterium sp. S3T4]MBB5612695.1 hypothetical protein [Janthinobacterium sp. S3M3]